MTNLAHSTISLKPGRQRRTPTLAAKDLGHVVAVQESNGLTSLVRIVDGRATCDCPQFTATKAPCPHVAAAARLVGDRHG